MIDFEAVRRAYHSPPPPGDHVPTIEERIAAYERQRMADARRRGLEPEAEAIGEFGSLIGGRGKPTTLFQGGRRAEDMVRMPPMPLPWFDHDSAHHRTPCAEPHKYLDTLAADHLAGRHPRPDGRTLHRLLRADHLNRNEAALVEDFLARLRMSDLAYLLSRAGLTIYEIARAMLLSGSRTPAKTHWINQFATRPQAGARPGTSPDCQHGAL